MPDLTPQSTPTRPAGIIRGHRIHVNDIPALFSEGAEPDQPAASVKPWLGVEQLMHQVRQALLHLAQALMPAQARDEKAVCSVAVRRQTNPQPRR